MSGSLRPWPIVIQVCDNDERYYMLDEGHLQEAAVQPRETRLAWLSKRWSPMAVRSDTDVDVVIVPDDETTWDDFDAFVDDFVQWRKTTGFNR